jgi:hypothetical protein
LGEGEAAGAVEGGHKGAGGIDLEMSGRCDGAVGSRWVGGGASVLGADRRKETRWR